MAHREFNNFVNCLKFKCVYLQNTTGQIKWYIVHFGENNVVSHVPNPEYSDYLPKVEPPPPRLVILRPVRGVRCVTKIRPRRKIKIPPHTGSMGPHLHTYMANTPRCLYNLGMYQGQNIERPPGVIPPLMAWKPQPQARHRIGLVKSADPE